LSVREEIVGKGEAILIHILLQLGVGARVNHSALNRFSGLSGGSKKTVKTVGCRVNGRWAIQLKQDVNDDQLQSLGAPEFCLNPLIRLLLESGQERTRAIGILHYVSH
jgi:hypothetical protein